MKAKAILVAALVFASVSVIHSESWPHWRGPQHNGVSRETNLPVRWSKTENIAWRIALPPRSGSTPVIWEDRIFLHVAEGDNLYLWRVNRANGAAVWKRFLSGGNEMARKANMSSPSPVTDGERVWALTGTGVLKAFTMDGVELWTRDLQKDYGAFGLNWNYSSSPMLYRDRLIIQIIHGMKTKAPSYLISVNKLDGATAWRVEREAPLANGEGRDAYTTPTLTQPRNAGASPEIVVTGGAAVTGHDPDTGKELWRVDGLSDDRIVASPLALGDIVFAPSRQRPLLAVKTGGRGNVTGTHVLWSFNKGPDVPTPVSDGQYLYVLTDNGVVYCLEGKTGATIYNKRLRSGTYSASPVLADGKLYVTNEDGITVVWKAGAEFELVAENDLDEFTLSSPAISDGQIFIRTETFLYAIGAPQAGLKQ
jgi:outer membrane protein assembly factor BamB